MVDSSSRQAEIGVIGGSGLYSFLDDVSSMWSAVLRRQPGELAFHATRPPDPELN